MITKNIPYSAHPVRPFEWIDSGERVIGANGLPEVVFEAFYPCCPEHGLMAQGSDYWYCEDCTAASQRAAFSPAGERFLERGEDEKQASEDSGVPLDTL